MFFSADLSLAAGEMRKKYFVIGSFLYDFTESQAASCKHFQAKTLSLNFSSTKKQKFLKTVSACTKKYIHLVTQSLLNSFLLQVYVLCDFVIHATF
jgi:hypothetical protein